MKRILITGGLGFIGSNFIEHMLAKHDDLEIINIDKCDYVSREYNVKPMKNYTYVNGDVTEKYFMRHVFSEFKPNYVIHFAAQSSVDESFERSFDFTRDNVLGTHVLLESLREYGKIEKFIHISTDEVYGEVDPSTKSTETAPLNPSNPYSATKAAAELYVKAYGQSFNIPWIITRSNNVFGPKQYPEKLIPIFLTNMLEGKKCRIHGTGNARRNFLFINDSSRAIETILYKGKLNAVYNIGTSHEYSVLDVFYMLKDAVAPHTNSENMLEFVKDRPYNDCRYCVDSTELRKLGWCENPNFEECLNKTIDWYCKHRDWYKT
jgi:nucleoside-diphosphate-sugar epimerase